MQTDAEKYLIELISRFLDNLPEPVLLMDLGAADSLIVENSLKSLGHNFVCDRSDIKPSLAEASYIGRKFICPLEDMSEIASNSYDLVFSNFVLEHIQNPVAAASEMARILKPGGKLVLSLSNPLAPEFILARLTPTSFHQKFRQTDHDPAYPIKYSYGSIGKMVKLLKNNGLTLLEDRRFPATYSYLHRFLFIGMISHFYDRLLIFFKAKSLMGHSVLTLSK